MEETINISLEEYKKLLEASVRASIFADFVNNTKYSIDREDCARYLGFEIKDEED